MANMTFGVNILPKSNTNVTLGNSSYPWTIVSPSLTGTPTAPTAVVATNNQQIATTAFVATAVSTKLDSNLGSGNAGKFLVVGNDGTITAVTMTAWSGGSY